VARILVIDDDLQLRSLLRLMLEGAGHEVTEAANGAQGVRAFRRRPADVVLCDLIMPVQEGLETIRELKADFPAVCVVAMSGGCPGGGLNFLPFAAKFGAAATLPKPFAMHELLGVVGNLLRDRHRATHPAGM
jgi:DNA-binding response OmpR family regulator